MPYLSAEVSRSVVPCYDLELQDLLGVSIVPNSAVLFCNGVCRVLKIPTKLTVSFRTVYCDEMWS